MAKSRIILIAAAVVVSLAGGAFFVLTSGEKPAFQMEASKNILRMEMAGVKAVEWPEMGVSVNGQDIGSLTVDSQQRKMFIVDIPNNIDPISNIELKITNQTFCQNVGTGCDTRKIIFRGLYLNDKKLEAGEPSGEKNTPYLLETADGGITWKIDG